MFRLENRGETLILCRVISMKQWSFLYRIVSVLVHQKCLLIIVL